MVCRKLALTVLHLFASVAHVVWQPRHPLAISDEEVPHAAAGGPPLAELPSADWPATDWEPFSPSELDLLAEGRARLGADTFDSIPADVISQFVRSQQHGSEPLADRLEATLAWRKERGIDGLLVGPPPEGRSEYERLMPAGVIGEDRDGRPVLLERPGRSREAVLEALSSLSAEEFVRQQLYSKECIRWHMAAASHRAGRRMYRFVAVVDCATIGAHHFDTRNVALLKSYVAAVSPNYPDSLERLYLVNSPMLMSAVWALVSPLLHPVTASKVVLLGSRYHEALAAAGVRIDGGDLPSDDELHGWAESTRRLRAAHPTLDLAAGYMPEIDAAAVRRLAKASLAARGGRARRAQAPYPVSEGELRVSEGELRASAAKTRLAEENNIWQTMTNDAMYWMARVLAPCLMTLASNI